MVLESLLESLSLSVEEGALTLVTLLLPKEMIFWEPFAAGPLEVRDRRVDGMLVDFVKADFWGCIWYSVPCGIGRCVVLS